MAFTALVLALSASGRAQQATGGGATASSTPAVPVAAVPATPAAATGSVTNLALVLKPTDHPRVSRDLSQLWMAPEPGRVRTAAQANLATAIKLESEGSHAKALALLTHPATAQQGPLAPYVQYYKGLAQLRMGRPAEARTTFQTLQAHTLAGFLAEASLLKEAESDEALNDYAAAVAVYERLAAMKTTAPDQVLNSLAKAARAGGDEEKAHAALERLYFDYPLSELAAAAAEELGHEPIVPGNAAVRRELGRAERLFTAKQYKPAKAAFERLRPVVTGDDRDLVRLRLAEADYYMERFKPARDALKPFADDGPRRQEAQYFLALTHRALGDRAEYATLVRRVINDFPIGPLGGRSTE